MMVPRLKPCRYSSVCFASQVFSGSVTLKNASLATFSNGPGVSIDAVVSARMNGGVSSTIGGTFDGNRHDLLRLDEVAQPAQHVAKARQQLSAGGMVLQRLVQNLFRGARLSTVRPRA